MTIDGKKWRKLYDDIGSDVRSKDSVANDIETSDSLSLHYGSQVEALRDVREQMRAIDSTLPVEGVDNG